MSRVALVAFIVLSVACESREKIGSQTPGEGDGGEGCFESPSGTLGSGTLATSLGNFAVSGALAVVSATHKTDADLAEAGCIASLDVDIPLAPAGCSLTLKFGTASDGVTFGGLTSARFDALSGCQGVTSADEGVYETEPGYAPLWPSGSLSVADPNSDLACIADAEVILPAAELRLFREDGRAMTVNFGGLTIKGFVRSDGVGAGTCPVIASCGAGFKNGGAGWCRPEGCSPGYWDGGGGECQQVGTCAAGFHDGGDGSCVAIGQCIPGYHDGGGGVCKAVGTCAAGWGLATDGTCRQWISETSLPTPRKDHTATLLADGRVLVVGGSPVGVSASALIFDPISSTWTSTGSLSVGRYGHEAVRLADGKVLVVGGMGSGAILRSSELFDPSTGTWSTTGSLNTERWQGRAQGFEDGRVIVVGGYGSGGHAADAEIYDPDAGSWSSTAAGRARSGSPVTLLGGSRILVVAGTSAATDAPADIYDALTNQWTPAGTLPAMRSGHTATMLDTGRVLVAGGGELASDLFTRSISGYSGTWTRTGAMSAGRDGAKAVLLADGRVLMTGGAGAGTLADGAEVYVPWLGVWQPAGPLSGRVEHSATLLKDRSVLVVGGADASGALSSVERYIGGR